MTILPVDDARFESEIPVVVVGAGACGLVAALSVAEQGRDVVLIDRDELPGGSTALSSGMIPAADTALQKAAGVSDSVEIFRDDIQRKSKGRSDSQVLEAATRSSGATIDWMNSLPGVALDLVEGFLYPGHTRLRMHAPADRTGRSLHGMLSNAAAERDIPLLTSATTTNLFSDGDGQVAGLRIMRPDGRGEDIRCERLILACNGFGGNPDMVARHIPEMANADYFGHTGNQGDAVAWGMALGGEAQHMSAYQGHGSVATPHGILISWALMMEGGIQVNQRGERFSNEHAGYSEQAVKVLEQPDGIAWCIYDQRLHELGLAFEDYRDAVAAGAGIKAGSIKSLAQACGLPLQALSRSIQETAAEQKDGFGRDFTATPALEAPYHAIKVTGALFHTQGGLRVDRHARVLRAGTDDPLGNLYAGGGAACGLSGPEVDGYLSGNGLLTAVTLGRLAGLHAGQDCQN